MVIWYIFTNIWNIVWQFGNFFPFRYVVHTSRNPATLMYIVLTVVDGDDAGVPLVGDDGVSAPVLGRFPDSMDDQEEQEREQEGRQGRREDRRNECRTFGLKNLT
jgi:hypothetical protein